MNQLLENYNIIATIDLNQILLEHPDRLYQQLKENYKPQYNNNDRIVLTLYGNIPQNFLDHLQGAISFLNITNCFVLLITSDVDIADKLKKSKKFTTDNTDIELLIHQEFDQEKIQNINFDVFKNPDDMCLAAWSRLEVDADGSVKVCCSYESPVKDEYGNEYNITKHNLIDVYQSKELVDLRKEFLAGKKPKKCNECWMEESYGLKSIRQHTAWDLHQHRYSINWVSNDLTNLKSVALCLGNVCNLKCVICHPSSSSSIASELIQQVPTAERKNSPLYLQLKNKQWVYKEIPLWDELINLADQIQEIRVAGGEPMLIDRHFEILKKLTETNQSNHITVCYATNGTVFRKDFINYWNQFNKIKISLSIDDLKNRFEYQRFGANWISVQENLAKYLELPKNKYEIIINCTVSIMNVFYLEEICKWIDSISVDHVELSVLYSPHFLSIVNLSSSAKTAILNKLKNGTFSSKFTDKIQKIISTVETSKTALNHHDFLQHIKKIDQSRGQNFFNSHGEIESFIKN